MNPILARRGHLGIYLLAWAPIVPLTAVLLGWRGESTWREALTLALPLVLVYAYLCLASWYTVKAAPLRSGEPYGPLTAHLLAALLSAALWTLLGWVWAAALAGMELFPGATDRYLEQAPRIAALGVPLYLAVAAVHYLLQSLEVSRGAEAEALRARVLTREAELKALKAQLDPHFLFNSLNAVASLAGSDPPAARRMAILLAEFLRRSLELGRRDTVPFGEELAHAAAYLAVERIRFGERLGYEEEVDDASRRCLVPPLILQPLVENAVRHGIAQLLEGGAVRVDSRVEEGRLRIAVVNPCDPDYPAPAAVTATGGGVGLANVSARLTARFRGDGRLEARSDGSTFRVELTLPAKPAAEPVLTQETTP